MREKEITIKQEETDYIDAWMREFIKNKEAGKIEQIPYETIRKHMPHTKISIEENR